MVRGCQSWLNRPGLDGVPVEWLYLTMQAEGLVLQVVPAERIGRVRIVLREAIAEVWGAGPGARAGRRLHTAFSIAYSNAEGPAAPLVEVVEGFSPASVTVTIPPRR
jgi:hypothetical protein